MLHQQQIRDAVNKPGLKERRFFHPVLDTFVRDYSHVQRYSCQDVTVIKLVVYWRAGDTWYLVGEAKDVPL